jgi:predicted DCC family thiol-disulfide oxidoreductase YuxK
MITNFSESFYLAQSVGSPPPEKKKAYGLEANRPIGLFPLTVVFDRECDLCRWSQEIVSRWDRPGRIQFLAYQDPRFIQVFPEFDLEQSSPSVYFVDEENKIWEGFEAVRQVFFHLPWGKPIAWLFYLPGVPWVAVRLYEWLAKNRYRFQRR